MLKIRSAKTLGIVAMLVLTMQSRISQAETFDFDNGNAAIQVIIPNLIPIIFQDVSPAGSDATLVLRTTTLLTNSWFDAIAPYHPTAVGVYSRLGRRPAAEAGSNRNKNMAMFYASYHVLNSLLPKRNARWRDMLVSVGLDPDDQQEDLTTAIGIGNQAGKKVVAAREHDGMNQLGDEGGRHYNRVPYADYTGYKPANTAYTLRHPGRWQPNMTSNHNGLFKIQQFVTPQLGLTQAYSYKHPKRFRAPPPKASNPKNRLDYQAQADEVLAVSAGLSDKQKMKAELFDNKINSLGFSALFASQVNGMSLDEFVQYDFLTNMAAFDGAIAIWHQKYRYDAVRPFSAIHYLYGQRPVTAWAGPGVGTVSDLPGKEWKSYLEPADHPEYPSASACFCAAHAQTSRHFLGSDVFGWSVHAAKGSSRIEPGITPAADLDMQWDTWSEFEQQCGQSRLWGGVHFSAAIDASKDMCHAIGDGAYTFVMKHINGDVD